MDEDKRFCPNCGAVVPPDHPYCSQCGAKVGDVPPGTAATPPAPGPAARPTYTYPGPGVAPPGPYAYPYYGPPVVPHAKTEGLAIASLVIAIFSFFFCPFIGSVIAIILGYIARDRIGAAQGRVEGDKLAHAAIVVGFAALAVHLVISIIALIVLTAVHPWRDIIVYGASLAAIL